MDGSIARRRRPHPLLIALAAIAVLFVAVWVALAIAFPPERLRAMVSAQLGRTLRRETRFGGVAISPLPPVRLTARSLELAEPGGFARGVALSVPSLHLDLDPWAMLSRRLEVRRLVLERPSVHLVIRRDGGTNFDSLMVEGPRRARTPMDLDIRSFEVDGGRVLVDDLSRGRRMFTGLDTRLAFSSRGSRMETSGETRLSQLAFGPLSVRRVRDLDPAFAKLEPRLAHRGRLDGRRLLLERLDVALGDASIALTGAIDELGPEARVDLKARGQNVELGEILDALSAADARLLRGIGGAGRLDFDLAVSGALGAAKTPGVTGRLSVRDGSFRWPEAPAGVDQLAFDARLGRDSLTIPELRARVGGQPLRAQIEATRFDDPRVRFAVQVSQLDLAAVSRLLASPDVSLAGRADINVRGRGRARDPGGMALAGNASLSRVSITSERLPETIENVQAAIEFGPTRAIVRGLAAKAGLSSFRANLDVIRPLALLMPVDSVAPARLTFDLVSPHLDVAELLPPGPGKPLALNAVGRGRVRIDRFVNQRLELTAVAADVELTPGIVDATSLRANGWGGALTGSGRFDLRRPEAVGYVLRARADTVSAAAFLDAMTPARNLLGGRVTTHFDVRGQGVTAEQIARTLTAVGFAFVDDGQLAGPVLERIADATRIQDFVRYRFKDARLPFRVERGRVVTDSVRLVGPNGDWRAAGSVGFDGRLDYVVSTTVPAAAVSRLDGAKAALAAGGLLDRDGRLLMDLRVTGPAKAPRVEILTASIRDRLAGRASDVFDEQRDRLQQELLDRLPGARDTARTDTVARQPTTRELKRELEQRGRSVLEGLFGRGRRTAAPDTVALPPAVPPADSGR